MIFCQVKVETPRNFFSSAAASTGLLLSAAVACTLTTRVGSCGRPLIPAGLAACAGRRRWGRVSGHGGAAGPRGRPVGELRGRPVGVGWHHRGEP